MLKSLIVLFACIPLAVIGGAAYELVEANQTAVAECRSSALADGWTIGEAYEQCNTVPVLTMKYLYRVHS